MGHTKFSAQMLKMAIQIALTTHHGHCIDACVVCECAWKIVSVFFQWKEGVHTEMRDRWLDVFVTRPDYDLEKERKVLNDDLFACTVQSVQIDPSFPKTAIIEDNKKATEWIMPTWSQDYDDAKYNANLYRYIKVGDLVRFGTTGTSGSTDYLTVLEIRQVDTLKVSTKSDFKTTGIPIGTTATNGGQVPRVSESTPYTFQKLGIAHICLRLNANLNCSNLPEKQLRVQRYLEGDFVTLGDRHLAYTLSNSEAEDEKYYYPLYVQNSWINRGISVELDLGVKRVKAVKLVSYAVSQKRQVGIHHGHEMNNDDFVILRIDEVPGAMVSNNAFAHGSFACLYAGNSTDNVAGGIEYNMFEPDGIITQTLPENSVFHKMTVHALDRLGKPAHIGRLHLWFKLLVSHG